MLVILRHQHPADRHLAAADVRVRVDGAGHDDAAVQRVFLTTLLVGIGGDDAAVADIDIADDAVDAVGRVVDFSAGELDQHVR